MLTVTREWSLLGRSIRRSVTTSPITDVSSVRFENRQRYLYLLVGFGCLVVGVLIGAQWFLNGLRAGYPFLTLIGALVVLSGVILDIVLYLFWPIRGGRTSLIITQGPWITRLKGVDAGSAERVMSIIHAVWRSH